MKSEGRPGVRWVVWYKVSERRWLCPWLHDVLEQLEGPHDVVILGRGEGREWLEFLRSSVPGDPTPSMGFLGRKTPARGKAEREYRGLAIVIRNINHDLKQSSAKAILKGKLLSLCKCI